MSTYPTGPRADFVEWCDVHRGVFVENAAAIGLTEKQATGFDEATLKAQSALLELDEAQQALLVKARQARDAVRLLRERTGESVRSIRAYAETTDEANKVYATAQIAPPAAQSPTPPPTKPYRLSATLEATGGVLALRWKARQPAGTSGTTYLVRRKLAGEAAFTFLGVAGKKAFVDEALPAGVANAQYTIEARRGEKTSGVSAVLLVNFGRVAQADESQAGIGAGRSRAMPTALVSD